MIAGRGVGSNTVVEPQASETALELSIRGRRFNAADGSELHAVGELEFALQQHSFTCIIGPSGCGKTTTLRMILGLDTGFEGDVRMAENARIGTVFQEPRLLPWRSVEQNVRLALPVGEFQRPLDELFEVLGLAKHRDLLPGELSLGLARRVALARAFALEPSLIVLDEPFVSLDETTASRLRDLLLSVWGARPTTVLMVTHDLEEAVALADRVLLFSSAPATVLESTEFHRPRHERDAAWRDSAVRALRNAMR